MSDVENTRNKFEFPEYDIEYLIEERSKLVQPDDELGKMYKLKSPAVFKIREIREYENREIFATKVYETRSIDFEGDDFQS